MRHWGTWSWPHVPVPPSTQRFGEPQQQQLPTHGVGPSADTAAPCVAHSCSTPLRHEQRCPLWLPRMVPPDLLYARVGPRPHVCAQMIHRLDYCEAHNGFFAGHMPVWQRTSLVTRESTPVAERAVLPGPTGGTGCQRRCCLVSWGLSLPVEPRPRGQKQAGCTRTHSTGSVQPPCTHDVADRATHTATQSNSTTTWAMNTCMLSVAFWRTC